MLLTCFRKDGTPASSPVTVALDGDEVFFRTYDRSWKARRLRRDPRVWLTPSTFRGTPLGSPIPGWVELLGGIDADRARRALARRAPLLQGLLVPAVHRLARYRTLHYRVCARPKPPDEAELHAMSGSTVLRSTRPTPTDGRPLG